MRVAAITFSRTALLHFNGFNTRLIADMLRALPEGSKLIGFGENQSDGTMNMFITSDKFKDIKESCFPSRIEVSFKRDHTGDRFDRLEMTEALEATATCDHEWTTYTGLSSSFSYCKKCNQKENA